MDKSPSSFSNRKIFKKVIISPGDKDVPEAKMAATSNTRPKVLKKLRNPVKQPKSNDVNGILKQQPLPEISTMGQKVSLFLAKLHVSKTWASFKKREKKIAFGHLFKKIYKYFMATFVLVIYISIASCIFYYVEKDERQLLKCPEACNNATMAFIVKQLQQDVPNKTSPVLKALLNRIEVELPKLTYWDAFHLIATSVTTIGYGDIYPRSVVGKVLTILFTLIGTPIMLTSMTSLGQFFGLMFHSLWVRFYKRYNKPPYTIRQSKMLKNKHYLPLTMGLIITVFWIGLSTFYFYQTLPQPYEREERTITVFDSFYFTMISFLTVGFGDISPLQHQLIIPTFIFLLVGLSLVTMCIDLTQTQLELLFDDVATMILERDVNIDGSKSNDTNSQISESASNYVRNVLKGKTTSLGTKMLLPLLSRKKQRQLKQLAITKKRFISRMIQTIPPRTQDASTQTMASKDFVYQINNDDSATPPTVAEVASNIKKRLIFFK